MGVTLNWSGLAHVPHSFPYLFWLRRCGQCIANHSKESRHPVAWLTLCSTPAVEAFKEYACKVQVMPPGCWNFGFIHGTWHLVLPPRSHLTCNMHKLPQLSIHCSVGRPAKLSGIWQTCGSPPSPPPTPQLWRVVDRIMTRKFCDTCAPGLVQGKQL